MPGKRKHLALHSPMRYYRRPVFQRARTAMSETFDDSNDPHRRRNALTGDWVLVSPHRAKRPWLGQTEKEAPAAASDYDASCYLCPGNSRMGGEQNPDYSAVYVFNNDFAALRPETPTAEVKDEFFALQAERGLCRVVCFSPNHNITLAQMSVPQIQAVIDTWAEQSEEIGRQHPWVQIFENKGATMGCSIPHPHCQIWAQDHAPTLLEREQQHQTDYYGRHGRPLLLDYGEREQAQGQRLVVENELWQVLVPYWAAWPFETLLLPKFPVARISELNNVQRRSLADIVAQLTIRYDNLFECAFPYSMGWHSAPFDQRSHREWQLHAHFYPPLLRSASVRKFMVGYEMMAEAQRDLTPEQAAQLLRAASPIHYKMQGE